MLDYFIPCIMLMFGGLLLLLNVRYGAGTPDESFYLSIPYRVLQGDALLRDEWHASQFSSFLQYLPMYLYVKLLGATDGIVLFFRYLYVVCQAVVGICIFSRFRKNGAIPAAAAALLFMLYVPEAVYALDYYTCGIIAAEAVCLLLFTTEKQSPGICFLIGVFTAVAVIAIPWAAGIYFIYTGMVLINRIKRGKLTEKIGEMLTGKKWAFLTLGITAVALVFIVYLFSRLPISQLIPNIKNLFSGHDHVLPFLNDGEYGSDLFRYFDIIKTLFSISPVMFVVSAVVFAVVVFDKNRCKHRRMLILLSFVVYASYTTALLIDLFMSQPDSFLFRPYPFFLFSLECLLFLKKRDVKLAGFFFISLLYTIVLGFTSQALNYVGVIGCVIAESAGVIIVIKLYRELKADSAQIGCSVKKSYSNGKYKWIVCTVLVSSVVISTAGEVLLSAATLKTPSASAESVLSGNTSNMSEKLTDGPLKGIKTNTECAATYANLLSDFDYINRNCDGAVLITGLIPWAYMYIDKPCAAFTSWFIYEETYLYKSYYELNPDKYPENIYVPSFFMWPNVNSNTITQTQIKKLITEITGDRHYEIINLTQGYLIVLLQN